MIPSDSELGVPGMSSCLMLAELGIAEEKELVDWCKTRDVIAQLAPNQWRKTSVFYHMFVFSSFMSSLVAKIFAGFPGNHL